MDNKDDKDDKDDAGLFQTAVAGVKPLVSDKLALRPPAPKPVPYQSYKKRESYMRESSRDDFARGTLEMGRSLEINEELLHFDPGVRLEIRRKMRRGKLCIQATVDLHGMTVAETHEYLPRFLEECHQNGHRMVLIIHGKGLGSPDGISSLKKMLNIWLRERRDVLAFCPAHPRDGGTGASYIMLKK